MYLQIFPLLLVSSLVSIMKELIISNFSFAGKRWNENLLAVKTHDITHLVSVFIQVREYSVIGCDHPLAALHWRWEIIRENSLVALGISCGFWKFQQRPLDSRMRTTTSTRFDLKFFAYCQKIDTPKLFNVLFFFNRKVSAINSYHCWRS